MKAHLTPLNIAPADYAALEALAQECLAACRATATDGTVLFYPDGSAHYAALWTRDFAYMVEGAGRLMDPAEVLAAIDYLLAGQREDGVIPDRRQADGLSVYCAGPVDNPLGEDPPTDNAQFIIKAVAAYVRLTGEVDAFLARRNALYRAIEQVPLNEDGLVLVDHNRPHSEYGFADCVGKTGNVFFTTVLYWEACQVLAELCALSEFHDEAHEWYERAEWTWRRIQDFWDEEAGLFWAASRDCHQLDLWGSLYACVVRVASKSQMGHIAAYFGAHWDEVTLAGQIRHLPAGETWQRLLTPVPAGTYQNGGFWATPSGWLIKVLAREDETFARELVSTLVADFQANGVHEWISPTQRALPGYVASITNVLGAVQPSKKLAPPGPLA
jgi:hypothetical protein